MTKVAIVGVGLIGGSFGLALRKAGFTGELLGVSSRRAIEDGLKIGAITAEATLAEAASRSDIIYLAQPVDRILDTLSALARLTGPDCLITDAGSSKQVIVDHAAAAGLASQFLGGHPMAGKEKGGVLSAEPDLFRHKPYILTPDRVANRSTLLFREWLDRIGAEVVEMSPEEHDRTVALTSHVPQIVSTALALTLARKQNQHDARIHGPGLLDMTRLAMSSAHLWTGILRTNSNAVNEALNDFVTCVREIQKNIATGDLEKLFGVAGEWAKSIRTNRP
jgi:prephenate dehydrogenase